MVDHLVLAKYFVRALAVIDRNFSSCFFLKENTFYFQLQGVIERLFFWNIKAYISIKEFILFCSKIFASFLKFTNNEFSDSVILQFMPCKIPLFLTKFCSKIGENILIQLKLKGLLGATICRATETGHLIRLCY